MSPDGDGTRSSPRWDADTLSRTAADDNRRYRDAVFLARLSRAATTADILVTKLLQRPDEAEHIVGLLSGVQKNVDAEISGHESWHERQHAAYLMTACERRASLANDLRSQLAAFVSHVQATLPNVSDNLGELREQADPIAHLARQLTAGGR